MTQSRPASRPAPSPLRKSSTSSRASTSSKLDLPSLALASQRKIQWDKILRGTDRNSQWKWLENARNFAIYTKVNDRAVKDAVLAIGVVKGSVPEVASLLTAFSQDEYTRKMAALHEKEFAHGTLVQNLPQPEAATNPWQLSVRSASFVRPKTSSTSWLRPSSVDEWCYLDATHMDKETQRFEQLLTTLRPQDVYLVDHKLAGHARFYRDVLAGFRVEPNTTATREGDDESNSPSAVSAGEVRVHFYAEHAASPSAVPPAKASSFGSRLSSRLSFTPSSSFSSSSSSAIASDKSTKLRLLHLAKSCDRLSQLVRRRRLGAQVLVDEKRIIGSLKTQCFNCDKSLRLLAKRCRVCGQGVCDHCSAKYERECHQRSLGPAHNRVLLEQVRVCDPCLARVEHANFAEISDAALAWQAVFPNSPTTKPAKADLKELLQDALLHAPSPTRKASVLSVIRCVLDQEKLASTPSTRTTPVAKEEARRNTDFPVVLTPVSTDLEYVDAMDYLDVTQVPYAEVQVADDGGRSYVYDAKAGDTAAQLAPPVPENEAQRLAAIEHSLLNDGKTLEELDIICDIAAKEIGSFASLISLITSDEQKVIGANMAMLTELSLGRGDSFCQHTIMGDAPLVVPYPEADVRFSKIVPVVALGARYYCGFPIVAAGEDGQDTVIGSLCCIDNKRNALNESQFAVLQKLAATASKIVRIQSQKRRTASARSVSA